MTNVRRVLFWLFCAPWYALGWLIGAMIWMVVVIAAALATGYTAGRRR